jgi:Flp pilus assembly protein TadD
MATSQGVQMPWRLSLLALATVLALTGCASSGPAPTADAREELRAGVSAAVKGYWQEALFRFERARVSSPDDPEVLNNLAVALEVAGRYDDALVTYKKAVEKAPTNTMLKKNYSRFAEFYSSFARGEKPKDEGNAVR